MKIPFIGGSYQGRSVNVNAQRTVNLMPVVSNQSKEVLAMQHTPGLNPATGYNLNSTYKFKVTTDGGVYFSPSDKVYLLVMGA